MQSELESEGKHASVRTICSVLGLPRSTFYYQSVATHASRPIDLELQLEIFQIIQQHPTYGLRRIRAMLHRVWANGLTARRSTGSSGTTTGRYVGDEKDIAHGQKAGRRVLIVQTSCGRSMRHMS